MRVNSTASLGARLPAASIAGSRAPLAGSYKPINNEYSPDGKEVALRRNDLHTLGDALKIMI